MPEQTDLAAVRYRDDTAQFAAAARRCSIARRATSWRIRYRLSEGLLVLNIDRLHRVRERLLRDPCLARLCAQSLQCE